LEERCLLGSQTSVNRGHFDINRSDGSGLGRGSNLVASYDFSHFIQIFLGEHKTNISFDVWNKPEYIAYKFEVFLVLLILKVS
jgi:hypothetical protein